MDVLAIVKRIEVRLSEIGMSKSEFYKKSGISSASFSQWRKGVYEPSEKKLIVAAEVLGLSLDFLLGNETYEAKEAHFANGIHVFITNPSNKMDSLSENLDLTNCRIVYNVPGRLIAVDNDAKATESDIAKIIDAYRVVLEEKKPTPKSERDGTDIMFALSRGGEVEITDEMYDEVKRFAAYLAQRKENE